MIACCGLITSTCIVRTVRYELCRRFLLDGNNRLSGPQLCVLWTSKLKVALYLFNSLDLPMYALQLSTSPAMLEPVLFQTKLLSSSSYCMLTLPSVVAYFEVTNKLRRAQQPFLTPVEVLWCINDY